MISPLVNALKNKKSIIINSCPSHLLGLRHQSEPGRPSQTTAPESTEREADGMGGVWGQEGATGRMGLTAQKGAYPALRLRLQTITASAVGSTH